MLLFCIHLLGGEVPCYYRLARQLGIDQPVYGFQARRLDGHAEAPQVTIEQTATEHVNAVRSFQPAGPYLLAGYFFGGASRLRWCDNSPATEGGGAARPPGSADLSKRRSCGSRH